MAFCVLSGLGPPPICSLLPSPSLPPALASTAILASLHARCASVVSESLQPVDCSPPGPSVHVILKARILEGVVMPSSRGSSRLRNHVSGRQNLYDQSPLGSPLASLFLLNHARHMPISMALHWGFLLPGILFVQVGLLCIPFMSWLKHHLFQEGLPSCHVHFFTL